VFFEYGPRPSLGRVASRRFTEAPCRRAELRVRLSGLEPGKKYFFRVAARSRFSTSHGRTLAFLTAGRRHTQARQSSARPLAQSHAIYWGAEIGPQLTGTAAPWDMNAVTAFQSEVGKAPSLVAFNIPFEGCASSCNYYTFPSKQLEAIRTYGAIPMLNWGSESSPNTAEEPDFQLADITSGAYDSYIRSFALAAKEWGHPFFLRYDWEMNGKWFPWSQGANGNHPDEYVTAWRHVHDIFTSAGAENVTWVWCPTADPRGEFPDIKQFYPGNSYVDWTCLDGYNVGRSKNGGSWTSFEHIYARDYGEIVRHVAPGKPMIVGEVASSEHGGSKAAWIREMLATLSASFSEIRAFVWFDVRKDSDGSGDWPVETSAASREAFRSTIAASAYRSNDYEWLRAAVIGAPPG
jgi:hypothetical protein